MAMVMPAMVLVSEVHREHEEGLSLLSCHNVIEVLRVISTQYDRRPLPRRDGFPDIMSARVNRVASSAETALLSLKTGPLVAHGISRRKNIQGIMVE